MRRVLVSLSICGALVAAVAAGSAPSAAPGSIVASSRVDALALTGRTIAFAVAPRGTSCPRAQLWRPGAGVRVRFSPTPADCADVPSTGLGISSVSVARSRLLWISFTGGNMREWSLWTATPTRRNPRRLRFVARDVDAPAPIVLGSGAAEAVPYAVDDELVYLADNGKPLFRRTLGAPVRALASHPAIRPHGAAVVALLASNELVGLDGTGEVETFRVALPAGVTAIAFDDRHSVLYQLGDVVHADGPDTRLPRGARMVDAARGRILWTRAGDLGVTVIGTSASRRLVDGSPARPVVGQLELGGLAWAHGRVVRWRPGFP